jgi:hypothetical protein
MPGIFERLTKDLTADQRADFYQTLNDTGISQNDGELMKLLLALQQYKFFYVNFFESIKDAADSVKKSESQIDSITDTLNITVVNFETVVDKIEKHIDESGKKAMAAVTDKINEYGDKLKAALTGVMDEALPLSDLKEAGKTFSTVVAENSQISEVLRKNAIIGKRVQYGMIAGACLLAILASWIFFYFRYEAQITETRISTVNRVVRQIEHNQEILYELSKANRTLELQYGEKGEKYLGISNAKGYTSTGNAGFIEFK